MPLSSQTASASKFSKVIGKGSWHVAVSTAVIHRLFASLPATPKSCGSFPAPFLTNHHPSGPSSCPPAPSTGISCVPDAAGSCGLRQCDQDRARLLGRPYRAPQSWRPCPSAPGSGRGIHACLFKRSCWGCHSASCETQPTLMDTLHGAQAFASTARPRAARRGKTRCPPGPSACPSPCPPLQLLSILHPLPLNTPLGDGSYLQWCPWRPWRTSALRDSCCSGPLDGVSQTLQTMRRGRSGWRSNGGRLRPRLLGAGSPVDWAWGETRPWSCLFLTSS